LNLDFHSCDVEDLPFEGASFDVVVSQFGHMFAPDPQWLLARWYGPNTGTVD